MPGDTADELEAQGHERLSEGHAFLARAARTRAKAAAPPLLDRWIPLHARKVVEGYEIKARRILDAGDRGEIELGAIGRTPAIRKSVLDAWIANSTKQRAIVNGANSDEYSEHCE